MLFSANLIKQALAAFGLATVLAISSASGGVHYVNANSANPVAPFSTWATASRVIQDAIEAASAGDEIVVTNGIYQTGGKVVYGTLPNRVAVTKPLTLRSVNGPSNTFIEGIPGASDSAVRCVYLTNGASLCGFTITNGGTRAVGDQSQECSGGGIWAESISATASNCYISSCSSEWWGGGAAFATLLDCVVTGNSAGHGGGAFGCALTNCIVANNSGGLGGGARQSTLDHCSVSWNQSSDIAGGLMDCTISFSDITNNSSVYSGGGGDSTTFSSCYIANNHSGTGGGGASSSILNNCKIIQNSADWGGGGCSFSSVSNCVLSLNSGNQGGASWYGTLVSCTITTNTGGIVGGCESTTLKNCILYYNTGTGAANSTNSVLDYCCTLPLPDSGVGNITAEPFLLDGTHISANSPCRAAGSIDSAGGLDIDGEPWANPPSIGCDEYYSTLSTNVLVVLVHADYTNLSVGFTADFTGHVFGQPTFYRWDLGDGTIISNTLTISHTWLVPGNYSIVLRAFNSSNPSGIGATTTVQVVSQPLHYVSENSVTPVSPYATWNTAARNIQDAIDAANFAGAVVLVSNGVYRIGGAAAGGLLSNRVAITKPLTVQSLNGPTVTVIEGYKQPNTVTGDSAVRCAYLGDQTALSGFTLTNGATRASGDSVSDRSAGGIWCQTGRSIVTNCVLVANQAYYSAGAVSGGTIYNSLIISNTVFPGSSDGSAGGGAVGSILNNCFIISNSGSYGAGGMYCTFNNCILSGNAARYGAASECTLNNCTVVHNFAEVTGAGLYSSTATNTIAYYNSAPSDPDFAYSTLAYCCTPALAAGDGNITNTPQFVDLTSENLRLQPNSPCINSGLNTYAPGSTDLDGLSRISGGTVDIGAYEFQNPSSIISYAWLQLFGLPTDGSADNADPDRDGMNNWQEWLAGTTPTNGVSSFRLISAAPATTGGVVVTWSSVSNRLYTLDRSTNLSAIPPFFTLQSHIIGLDGSTTWTDSIASGDGPFLYRVSVTQ